MKSKNLFWGIFFIALSGLIIVNQLGYLIGITTFNLVIAVLLIPIFLKSIIRMNFFGIFFSIAILGIIFSDKLGIGKLVPFPILVIAAFVSIGFSIIFGKHNKYVDKWSKSHRYDEDFSEVIDTEDDDTINFEVKFGSSTKYVNSKNLTQANFSCSFGALKIYLDNANVSSEGAVINVDASFSGIEVYVPRDWNIINRIECTLAGIEEKYNRYEHIGPSVKLTGKAKFSGIEIIYV